MTKLEKERRYLIQLPLSWVGKFKVFTSHRKKIYQTYIAGTGHTNTRVRAIMNYDFGRDKNYAPITYTQTTKQFITDGVNKETEHALAQWEYRNKLEHADKTKHRITKTRYILNFDQREFELDVFEDQLLGLAILEIELEDMMETVLLPPYLKVIKEVTNDKWYSNINLANLTSYKDSIEAARFPRRID